MENAEKADQLDNCVFLCYNVVFGYPVDLPPCFGGRNIIRQNDVYIENEQRQL